MINKIFPKYIDYRNTSLNTSSLTIICKADAAPWRHGFNLYPFGLNLGANCGAKHFSSPAGFQSADKWANRPLWPSMTLIPHDQP